MSQSFIQTFDQGIGRIFDAIINEGPGLIGRLAGKIGGAAMSAADSALGFVGDKVTSLGSSMTPGTNGPQISPVQSPQLAQAVQHDIHHVDRADLGNFTPTPVNFGAIQRGVGQGIA